MNSLSRRLATIALTRALSRPCEARIPRSGARGAAVNCFTVAIDKGNAPYLIVLGLADSSLSCIEWDGASYQIPRNIPLSDFTLGEIRFTHYYGHSEVTYDGVLDFLWNRTVAWPYLQIHVVRRLSVLDQYLFNKKKLVTQQRKGLLKVLLNRTLDGDAEHDPLDLMTDLYTIRWYSHPQGDDARRRLEVYLESLVETGELKSQGHNYVVTGEGVRALEEYEEQERKHAESVKLQGRALWVAVAVAVLTVFQAGLVKLPPVLDFTTSTAAK
jgi:hypothetical protein